MRVSYVPPVLPMPPVPPVTPVPSVPPVKPVPSLPPIPPAPPVPSVMPMLATISAVMTPVMSPSTPMVPSSPGATPPSSPKGTDNPPIDEAPLDNEPRQQGQTLASRTADYQATRGLSVPGEDDGDITPGHHRWRRRHHRGTMTPVGQRAPSTGTNTCEDEGVPSGDLYGTASSRRTFQQSSPNQPIPALPICDASQCSEPTTYQKEMRSPYHASWYHAMEREITRHEEAGTFGDT